MGELEGQVAIITGGASGIGESMAKTFAMEGASVIIADINVEKGLKVVEKIEQLGGTAVFFKADASNEKMVKDTVDFTLDRFGRIDILVNNVGIGYGLTWKQGGSLKTYGNVLIENLSEEEWDRVMNVNLKSVFLFSKHVIPTMKKQRSGNIISISSEAGQTGGGSKGGSGPAYAVTKAAIMNFTKTLARQLGEFNIRANCIAPGPIGGVDPDGTTSHGFPMTDEEIGEELEVLLVKRVGTPQDVANTALFLASEKSSYIDGQTISVSGGKIMR